LVLFILLIVFVCFYGSGSKKNKALIISQEGMQRLLQRVDPEFGYVVVAFLFACSLLLFLRDNVLGKVVMVSAIIALTLYHRIAGIVALIVVISVMQQTKQREGLTTKTEATADATKDNHPLIGSAATASAIQFATAAEFREKYCMKGVGQGADQKPELQYMLSPALFDDRVQLKLEAIKQMNVSSMNAANSCKSTPPNSTNPNDYVSIANMCDPGCNWTTNPTNATKEGFTPALRPHIRNGRRLLANGAAALNSGVNRLKRQIF
jgi:hypothetical protein